MHKNVLKPVKIASNQVLSSSFTSAPTIFTYTDNISYQINITTTDSVGSFQIEGSLDYVPNTPLTDPAVAGNWAPLVLSGTPVANAANTTLLININECPYNALRVRYTSSVAGTGHCDIFVMAKGLS